MTAGRHEGGARGDSFKRPLRKSKHSSFTRRHNTTKGHHCLQGSALSNATECSEENTLFFPLKGENIASAHTKQALYKPINSLNHYNNAYIDAHNALQYVKLGLFSEPCCYV